MDAITGQKLKELKGHLDYVTTVAYMNDGRYVISGCWDQTMRIWDVESGSEIKKFNMDGGYAKMVCASPDGKFILAGSTLGHVEMWDVATGQKIKTFAAHKDEVRGLACSVDKETFLSCSMDGSVKLWNIAEGSLLNQFNHRAPVYVVAFSKDGKLALSGSADKSMKMWDIASGKELFPAQGHVNGVLCMSVSNHNRLASGSDDKTGKIWDICSAKVLKSYGDYEPASTAFDPTGNYVVTGGWDTIHMWNSATGELVREFKGHNNNIQWIQFSSDGKFMYSASLDGNIKKWDVPTGKELLNILTQASIECAILLEGQNRVICGHWNGNVTCWDMAKSEMVYSLKAHELTVRHVALVRSGKYLVSASEDEHIKIWDMDQMALFASQRVGPIRKVATFASQEIVAVALAEKKLEFWKLFPMSKMQDIVQTTQAISLAVSKHGKLLVGNVNGTIYSYKAD